MYKFGGRRLRKQFKFKISTNNIKNQLEDLLRLRTKILLI